RYDPHGDPIPTAEGELPPKIAKPLVDSPPGTRFRLARVTDQSPEFLRYLTQSGLSLGTTAAVVANRVEAGILVLETNGRQITLSRSAAEHLLIAPLEPVPKVPETNPFPPTEPLLSEAAFRDTPRAVR
ncbi:MAG TPA: FeoA family protein, partial [Thermoguttaceae bacterium]|nr:FeoA family protein [Thermoguttaceae bacterium]